MLKILDYQLIVLVLTLGFMVFCVWLGGIGVKRFRQPNAEHRDDFAIVLSATLTLLALIIGFTFSMATVRYDQRKNLEEEEANAIGTEYLRAGLLPAADAEKARALLRDYYEQRILFYTIRDGEQMIGINARMVQLQNELWESVNSPAANNPTPTVALAVSGMNDVINSQGYAQAAAWNRIPTAAWLLMAIIAAFCHLLFGFGTRDARGERILLFVLPLVTALSFFLIADIDSPRGGVIRVYPENLTSISGSLR